MKPHEFWAMMLLASIITQVQMNACSSLDLACANATGTRGVPLAAQSSASPDVTTVLGSERYRLRRVELTEPVTGMGEVELAQKLIESPFAKHQKTQRIGPKSVAGTLLLDGVVPFCFLSYEQGVPSFLGGHAASSQ